MEVAVARMSMIFEFRPFSRPEMDRSTKPLPNLYFTSRTLRTLVSMARLWTLLPMWNGLPVDPVGSAG